jgi:hypothetical protein
LISKESSNSDNNDNDRGGDNNDSDLFMITTTAMEAIID